MAINSINHSSAHNVRSNSLQSERTQGIGKAQQSTAPTASTQGQDQVKFTEQSQKLRDLEQTMAQEPSFDAERVEALRKAINSGEYQVNAQRVADKLLDLEGELFK